MSTIRVWHAPEPTRAPKVWKAPEPDTSVRDSIWEKARHDGQCIVERRMAQLCPKVVGGRRTGADLARELAPVKEPEPDLLLTAYTKPRSVKKPVMGPKTHRFRGGGRAYYFHTSTLGET